MATGFIETAKKKLAGILADVSTATTAVTAREDAVETVDQLSEVALHYSFTETTAAAVRTSDVYPIPFNCKVAKVSFAMTAGGQAAQGYTNYATFALMKNATDGSTTSTIAAWSPITDTVTLWNNKDLVITAANQVLTRGQSVQFHIAKTGSGATTGASTMMAVLRRLDD